MANNEIVLQGYQWFNKKEKLTGKSRFTMDLSEFADVQKCWEVFFDIFTESYLFCVRRGWLQRTRHNKSNPPCPLMVHTFMSYVAPPQLTVLRGPPETEL